MAQMDLPLFTSLKAFQKIPGKVGKGNVMKRAKNARCTAYQGPDSGIDISAMRRIHIISLLLQTESGRNIDGKFTPKFRKLSHIKVF